MALQLTNVLIPASSSQGSARLTNEESALRNGVNLLKNNDISDQTKFGEIVREVAAGNTGLAVGRAVPGVNEANPMKEEFLLALTQLRESVVKLLERGAVLSNDTGDQPLPGGNNMPSAGNLSPLRALVNKLEALLAKLDKAQSSLAERGGEFPGAGSIDIAGDRADPHLLSLSVIAGNDLLTSLSSSSQLAQDAINPGGLKQLANADGGRATALNLLDAINEQFAAATAPAFIDQEAVDHAVKSSLAILSVLESNINAGVGALPNLASLQSGRGPGIARFFSAQANSAIELAKGQAGRPGIGNAQATGIAIDSLESLNNPQQVMSPENSALPLPGKNQSQSASVDAAIKPASAISINSTATFQSSAAMEQLLNLSALQGAAQTEPASAQEARGVLQQLLASTGSFTAPSAAGAGAATVANESSGASLFQSQISQPVTSEQWGAQFGQRLAWLAGQGIKAADIHLNPPELGSLQVRIEQTDNASRVIFAVQHAATRETLEMNIPRLRDLFADQGLTLVDVESHDMSGFTSQDSGAGQSEPGAAEDHLAEVSSTDNNDIVTQRVDDEQAPGLVVLNYGYIDAYA